MSNKDTPFTPPTMTAGRHSEMTRAARAHAEGNRSDPFAFGRAMAHMRRGIEKPGDIAPYKAAPKNAAD